jgi:Polyphosphate kinase 2 (PPK2)
MSVPSLSVSVHHRYTPEIRDRILGKLQASTRHTAHSVLTPAHLRALAEIDSPDAPVLSLYLQLGPERRTGGAWRTVLSSLATARLKPIDNGRKRQAMQDEFDRNAFERHLAENDVTILKFYLHISKKEQKERLQARLDDPAKRWKFNPADLAERKHWHDYIAAYQIALKRCSTEWAPWFIVPADRKWYRNAVVARILRTTLEALDLTYPPDLPGLDKIRIE